MVFPISDQREQGGSRYIDGDEVGFFAVLHTETDPGELSFPVSWQHGLSSVKPSHPRKSVVFQLVAPN